MFQTTNQYDWVILKATIGEYSNHGSHMGNGWFHLSETFETWGFLGFPPFLKLLDGGLALRN